MAIWKAKRLDQDADQVIYHVRAMANSDDWKKQGGQFIPAPLTYLRQARWDGADAIESAGIHFVGGHGVVL